MVDVAITAGPGVAAARLAGLRRLGPEADTVAPVAAEELLARQVPRTGVHAIGEHLLLRELPAAAVDAFIALRRAGLPHAARRPPSCAISEAPNSRSRGSASPAIRTRPSACGSASSSSCAGWRPGRPQGNKPDSHPRDLRRCNSMRLHDYAASGNCYKVRLLLSLLGREYERVPVDIFAGDTLTDAFGVLNPVRETPVLERTPARSSRSRARSSGTWPRTRRSFRPDSSTARSCSSGSPSSRSG